MSTVHTSSKNSWLLHHNDISASKDFTAKTCESQTSTTNLKENLKAFWFAFFFLHLESSMIRWTIYLRSPRNSVPSERHSLLSKRNLLFLLDSKPPYSGKNLPMNLRQMSYSKPPIPGWKLSSLENPSCLIMVAWFLPLFKTTGPNQKQQKSLRHVSMYCYFRWFFLPTKCFESQNNFGFG